MENARDSVKKRTPSRLSGGSMPSSPPANSAPQAPARTSPTGRCSHGGRTPSAWAMAVTSSRTVTGRGPQM